MNFLEQIAARVGLEFIGSCEPVDGGPINFDGLFVERVLAHFTTRNGLIDAHIQIVVGRRRF